MTAKLSSRPCQPTALGRRFRITVSALALSALIGLGAAPRRAARTPAVSTSTPTATSPPARPSLQRNLHRRARQHRRRPVDDARARRRATKMSRSAPCANASVTTGSYNVATGYQALIANTAGNQQRRRRGGHALATNTDGSYNVASGYLALEEQPGNDNVAIGDHARREHRPGSRTSPPASGAHATAPATTTSQRLRGAARQHHRELQRATGRQALRLNTTADGNAAIGVNALFSNTDQARQHGARQRGAVLEHGRDRQRRERQKRR